MTAFLVERYNEVATFTERNILTTPLRKKTALVAVAITASTVGSFYLGFPRIPEEYGRNMGVACARSISSLVQQLPEQYQCFNATSLLQRLPESKNSCLVSMATYIARIGLGAVVGMTIPVIAFGKMFAISGIKPHQD